MRFRFRTLLIGMASFLIGLGATLWADRTFYALLHTRPLDIPYFVKLIRAPGEILTWQLVLGDMGSEAEWRFWVPALGAAFYACVGWAVALMANLHSTKVHRGST